MKKVNSDEDNRLFMVFNDKKTTFWGYLKPICTTFRNNFSAQSVDHHLKFQNQKSFEKFIWYLGKKSILKIEKKNLFINRKTTKVDYLRRYCFFFKFSLFIRVSLLKIHIPWKFGEYPIILHENRLFEYTFMYHLLSLLAINLNNDSSKK